MARPGTAQSAEENKRYRQASPNFAPARRPDQPKADSMIKSAAGRYRDEREMDIIRAWPDATICFIAVEAWILARTRSLDKVGKAQALLLQCRREEVEASTTCDRIWAEVIGDSIVR